MATPDLVAVALRGLGFVAGFQAAGIAIFVWLFGDDLAGSRRRVRLLGTASAFAALALTIAHHAVEPARLVGAWQGVVDASMHALLLNTDAGAVAVLRLAGLALVAVGGLGEGRGRGALAVIGATLFAVSFALTGHTAADERRWLLAGLLILHLLAVLFWFGALLPLHLVSRYGRSATAGLVVARFSALAAWIVPLIFVAGAVIAAVLLPTPASLLTPYGLLLLGKIAGFALLMGLASFNKWRWGPGIAAGRESAITAFRVSVLAEWLIIAIVLMVTATMTSWFSP